MKLLQWLWDEPFLGAYMPRAGYIILGIEVLALLWLLGVTVVEYVF